jgi:valyl-tRNA synthetase
VVITATIQAADGSRMSKSKGNAIDPLVMVDQYGADAVRAWGAAVGTSGQDMRFDEDRIRSYQRFANKLWNVTRFLGGRIGAEDGRITSLAPVDPAALRPEDRWMLVRTAETVRGCDRAIASYRFHEAMDRLYDTVWRIYCDWYIEMVKVRLRDDADPVSRATAAWTAVTVLDVLVRALHPFMPFVTEECAQYLPDPAATLQRRDWPSVPDAWLDARWRSQSDGIEEVLELVQQVRNARQEAGIAPANRERHGLVLDAARARLDREDVARLLEALAPVRVGPTPVHGGAPVQVVAGGLQAALHLGGTGGDDPVRLVRQSAELEERIMRLEAQLGTRGFIERARPEVVDEARRKLVESQGQRDALRRFIDGRTA